jgi:hypothetical protein
MSARILRWQRSQEAIQRAQIRRHSPRLESLFLGSREGLLDYRFGLAYPPGDEPTKNDAAIFTLW